jgi:hypothetical protein
MDMDGAVHIGPAAQNAAVQGEAGTVDARTLVEVVVHADLDEVGCGDLGVEQLVALDQEVPGIRRAAHGGVVEDNVAPAVTVEQPVDRGQIDARLAVVGGDGRCGSRS